MPNALAGTFPSFETAEAYGRKADSSRGYDLSIFDPVLIIRSQALFRTHPRPICMLLVCYWLVKSKTNKNNTPTHLYASCTVARVVSKIDMATADLNSPGHVNHRFLESITTTNYSGFTSTPNAAATHLPLGFPTFLETGQVWTPAEFADETRFVVNLTEEDKQELDDALEGFKCKMNFLWVTAGGC